MKDQDERTDATQLQKDANTIDQDNRIENIKEEDSNEVDSHLRKIQTGYLYLKK